MLVLPNVRQPSLQPSLLPGQAAPLQFSRCSLWQTTAARCQISLSPIILGPYEAHTGLLVHIRLQSYRTSGSLITIYQLQTVSRWPHPNRAQQSLWPSDATRSMQHHLGDPFNYQPPAQKPYISPANVHNAQTELLHACRRHMTHLGLALGLLASDGYCPLFSFSLGLKTKVHSGYVLHINYHLAQGPSPDAAPIIDCSSKLHWYTSSRSSHWPYLP